MIDASDRVEFDDVEVIGKTDFVVMCRIGDEILTVPSRHMLPGTTISGEGGRGHLVLPRQLALTLGLIQGRNGQHPARAGHRGR